MRAASVGFQCPECVAAGAATVRQGRTLFGGRVADDSGRLTTLLVAVNVAVFVLGLLAGGQTLALDYGNLAGPAQFEQSGEVQGVVTGQYYRLLTAAFLHANVLHLVLNMVALLQIGRLLETALGRTRYLALYVLSALGGSTLSFLLADPFTLGVGASGALFGLFGAYFVVLRRLQAKDSTFLVLMAVNLVITFTVPIIDWRAHIGGLLTGAAVAAVLAYAPKGPRRATVQLTGCAVVAVLLVLAVVLRAGALSA